MVERRLTMREYIDHVVYEGSGLLIGRNNKGSIILGEKNTSGSIFGWVVLDKHDVKKVSLSLSEQKKFGQFDGFNFKESNQGLSFGQGGDSVYVDKSIFQQYLQTKPSI